VKGSDYVAQFLKSRVDHVFGLQGGAVVHLFDSCERLGPKPIYCHHEQAAALAAGAYARVKGYGVCIVTTGPGSTNALTGLLGCWQDSIPCMFISGQTRLEHTSYGKPVRQVGTQELAILDVVRPLTKAAYLVESLADLPGILEDGYQESVSNRPGPVWIDFPVNLQWSTIS
jgi:acetolactate synthase I/II/III large subunit